MKNVLIDWSALLLIQLSVIIGIRYIWKPIRYTLARGLRRYANWVSPDNF